MYLHNLVDEDFYDIMLGGQSEYKCSKEDFKTFYDITTDFLMKAITFKY